MARGGGGGADVATDSPHAGSSVVHAKEAAAAGKPVVIGSTSLTKEQTGEIRASAETIACVLSPNMSVGVNLMFRVAADVARVLGDDYDVETLEPHHRFKKDSPSGTAVTRADAVAGALGRDMKEAGVYGRHGTVGERTRKGIGEFAVRAGDGGGETSLVFCG